MKATEQYFPAVLFVMLHNEILKCNHSNESQQAVLSHDSVNIVLCKEVPLFKFADATFRIQVYHSLNESQCWASLTNLYHFWSHPKWSSYNSIPFSHCILVKTNNLFIIYHNLVNIVLSIIYYNLLIIKLFIIYLLRHKHFITLYMVQLMIILSTCERQQTVGSDSS